MSAPIASPVPVAMTSNDFSNLIEKQVFIYDNISYVVLSKDPSAQRSLCRPFVGCQKLPGYLIKAVKEDEYKNKFTTSSTDMKPSIAFFGIQSRDLLGQPKLKDGMNVMELWVSTSAGTYGNFPDDTPKQQAYMWSESSFDRLKKSDINYRGITNTASGVTKTLSNLFTGRVGGKRKSNKSKKVKRGRRNKSRRRR